MMTMYVRPGSYAVPVDSGGAGLGWYEHNYRVMDGSPEIVSRGGDPYGDTDLVTLREGDEIVTTTVGHPVSGSTRIVCAQAQARWQWLGTVSDLKSGRVIRRPTKTKTELSHLSADAAWAPGQDP